MTQRVFDVNNEQDMKDLWDILPEMVKSIEKDEDETEEETAYNRYMGSGYCLGGCPYININWNDKTKITRPIQEATEEDIGKLCRFSLSEKTRCSISLIEEHDMFGILTEINNNGEHTLYLKDRDIWFNHCRRLTKQEIEELC